MSVEEEIKKGLKEIIKELVNGNYGKLKQLDKIGTLKPEEVRKAVDEYLLRNERLTMPSIETFENDVKIMEIVRPKKYRKEFGVFIDLGVNDEKSDLTLHCEAWEDEKGGINVSIYEIRVF